MMQVYCDDLLIGSALNVDIAEAIVRVYDVQVASMMELVRRPLDEIDWVKDAAGVRSATIDGRQYRIDPT